VNTFVRLIPILFAGLATQVLAGDPPAPKTVDPDKPAASAAAVNADASSAAAPTQAKVEPEATAPQSAAAAAAAAAKPERLVLEDKTLTNPEVSRLLAQGYRPQKGRGDDVLYCRSEQPIGTRFAKKVCKTAEQIKSLTQDSKDVAAREQMPGWNPTGK
jgi:hypothetical protein